MERRAFTFLSALSLLLCAASCALWVRSHFVALQCYSVFHVRGDCGISGAGLCRDWVFWMAAPTPQGDPEDHWWWNKGMLGCLMVADSIDHQRLGVGWHWESDGWAVRVPLWAVACASAVMPLTWLGRTVRTRAGYRRPGRCRTCGFDLRATPDRCPECGTPVEWRLAGSVDKEAGGARPTAPGGDP